jgi:hypothetical protein
MVRIVVRVESRVCTTSRTKGHSHLKNMTPENQETDRINSFPMIANEA